MQGTNVLFGQIAVVFGIVIAGVWGATQWTAAALGYQLRLGSPWFDFFGTPVYHPWRLFEWWFFFDAYAPRVFDTGGAIAGGSGLVAVLVAIGMSIWRSRQSRVVTTYGSARWANADDIRKAGLTQPAGVFLGQHDRQYLRHEGPEHVLTFAPTRSGKGVGLVVPTLLSWPASAVIHDIKGENWQITAGWRSRFSHCLLFNPTDAKSAFQAGSAAAGGGAKGAMAGLGNVAKTGAQFAGRAATSRASAAGQRMAAPFRPGWNGWTADAGASTGQASAGEAPVGGTAAQKQEQPAWAKRLHRRQQLTHAATTAAHTLRGGDGGGSGQGPSLRGSDD